MANPQAEAIKPETMKIPKNSLSNCLLNFIADSESTDSKIIETAIVGKFNLPIFTPLSMIAVG